MVSSFLRGLWDRPSNKPSEKYYGVHVHRDGPVNPVICTYDLRRFRGDIVVDVMRTHPLIIIGGILQENPFFVPPDKFLEQLRERGTTRIK